MSGALSALDARKFDGAVEKYTAALERYKNGGLSIRAPMHARLLTALARALFRAGRIVDCLRRAEECLYYREDEEEAVKWKCKALMKLEREEEALDVLSPLMSSWGAALPALREAYDKAEFEVRRKKRVDYYEVFGLGQMASEMEIKKQYKVRALEVHPDKQHGKSLEEKKRAEETFKMLGEGLEVLCDQRKRELYDKGFDLRGIRERMEAEERGARWHEQNRGRGPGHHH